jgi:hypothetical protein
MFFCSSTNKQLGVPPKTWRKEAPRARREGTNNPQEAPTPRKAKIQNPLPLPRTLKSKKAKPNKP